MYCSQPWNVIISEVHIQAPTCAKIIVRHYGVITASNKSRYMKTAVFGTLFADTVSYVGLYLSTLLMAEVKDMLTQSSIEYSNMGSMASSLPDIILLLMLKNSVFSK